MKPKQITHLKWDALVMEEVFIEQQTLHSSMKETFKHIHPFTPYRGGLTTSLHGGGLEESIDEWKVLSGFHMLYPVEFYGQSAFCN